MRRCFSLHLSFFVLLTQCAASAGNGKLSGRIFDAHTRAPIPGNVTVVGTVFGASADSVGAYFILGIPPGLYDIRCSAVGYTDRIVTGFAIAPDNLRKLDFGLPPADINVGEIVVESDRLAVESSQTSARTDFDGSEFRALPLNSSTDLIALSPGTFKQFIGGALPVFSRALVDGIDITDETALWYTEHVTSMTGSFMSLMRISNDPYGGSRNIDDAQHSSFIDPAIASIGQATLLTGTSGADYAGAVGTLSYTLREGGESWGGEAYVRTSQVGGLHHLGPDVYWDANEYFAIRDRLAAGTGNDPLYAKYYTWTPGKYSYGVRPDVTVSLAGGGPVSDAARVFMTGMWRSTADRLPNDKKQWFDGSLKFTWSPTQATRLSVVGLLRDRGRLFGWKNSSYTELYRYFLEGVPLWDGIHITGGLTWSHFLTKSTSYELQVSVVHDNIRRGFCDDNNDGVISLGEHGNFLTFGDTAEVSRYQAVRGGADPWKFFAPGAAEAGSWTKLVTSYKTWMVARPPLYYENSTSRVITFKAGVSSQVDPHHLLGTGAQLRLHTYDRVVRTGAVALTGQPFTEDLALHHPAEVSVYAQDRMEFSGMIMNLGIRLEGIWVDAAQVLDWFAPPVTVVSPDGKVNISHKRGASLPWKWFLAPQIAFSHPVGSTAAIHAAFSRTRLSLPYSYLYANYSRYGYSDPLTNVDQATIVATNYDLGVLWSAAPATLLGINAYYHDRTNMDPQGMQIYPVPGFAHFYLYTNAFGVDAKGIEISLQRGLTPLGLGITAGGRLAYAYGKVNIGNAVPTNKWQFAYASGDSLIYGGQLPFADVPRWDRSNTGIPGNNSTLTKGFDRVHRVTCAFVLGFPWDIRLTGTGTFSSGFWYPRLQQMDRIIPYAEAPWNRRVDVRLEKRFTLTDRLRVDLFVDVLNLFNWTNILTYFGYPETAQAAWEVTGDPTGGYGVNRPVTDGGSMVYDIPREAYVGARVVF